MTVPFNVFSHRTDYTPQPTRWPDLTPPHVPGHRFTDPGCECGDRLDVTVAYWTGDSPPLRVRQDAWWRHVKREGVV